MGSYLRINGKPLANSKQYVTYFFGAYKRLHNDENLFEYENMKKIFVKKSGWFFLANILLEK